MRRFYLNRFSWYPFNSETVEALKRADEVSIQNCPIAAEEERVSLLNPASINDGDRWSRDQRTPAPIRTPAGGKDAPFGRMCVLDSHAPQYRFMDHFPPRTLTLVASTLGFQIGGNSRSGTPAHYGLSESLRTGDGQQRALNRIVQRTLKYVFLSFGLALFTAIANEAYNREIAIGQLKTQFVRLFC